jgi:hypothetical protein
LLRREFGPQRGKVIGWKNKRHIEELCNVYFLPNTGGPKFRVGFEELIPFKSYSEFLSHNLGS